MNPLIRREFFGILRAPKALVMLLALTFAFSVGVLMRWPSDASVDLSGEQSMQVFRIFGYGLLAGVVFLVPAFPATSVVNEKKSGTLALLLNSPMTAWGIYFGKLSGVLLFSLLVLLSSLPGSAACFAMGGISAWDQLGMLYLILFVLVVQYATVGMLVSSFVQSSDAAVRITYAVVLGLLFLTLLPAAFLRGTGNGGGFALSIAAVMRYFSPLPAVMEIMRHSDVAAGGLKETSTAGGFVWVTLSSSVVLALITLSRLNYRIFDQSREQGVMTNERGAMARAARRIFYVVDPQRRKSGIPWYLNPVMVKEFRSRRFGRSQWLLRLVAACAVVSLVLTVLAATSVTSWGVEKIGGLLVLLQVVLIVVLTPSLASGLISSERDNNGWDLLRMTPLSSVQILRGKLLSVVWTLALVLMATLPGYLMMVMILPSTWLQVYLVLICLVWTAIYVLALSSSVGSLFRSTAVSTTVSYVVVIAVFLTPLLVWLGRDTPFGHDTVRSALLATPVAAALSVIAVPGFETFDLLPAAWWIAGLASAFFFLLMAAQVWRLTRTV
ncbi:ABC transporter permease subunit [Novipirellula artificiosorum]|uniref:ABC-2 family transporter protein n=1 Tax=Novipirellula artificiosorum TaxID=2528016 RepID=A0A5C6DUY2_9BACT|nr:ABC transporter permease subunit [Novipirellula artificiosorum]TWU40500.1 ABC-2 family transporter protein [Novipirellula artificiosorum]